MTQLERNKAILQKYIPLPAVDVVADWIYRYDFKLKIKRGRLSKYGDYRSPINGLNHCISVNRDLNPYAFLITLVHEVAHLTNWQKNKNSVKPHGDEWKSEFRELMQPFFLLQIFPHEIKHALKKYLVNPAASGCTDVQLYRVLRAHDNKPGLTFLEEIPERTTFKTPAERLFVKGERLRKRYLCVEVTTGSKYLFHPLTEVFVLSEMAK